jgi:hypothetical protein
MGAAYARSSASRMGSAISYGSTNSAAQLITITLGIETYCYFGCFVHNIFQITKGGT